MNQMYTIDGLVQDKNNLLTGYVPLIRREVLRFKARLPASVELDDLIQVGMITVLYALDNFDEKHGVSFEQYIVQRIRWALLDELRERDWVPRSVRRGAREIAAAIHRVEQRKGALAKEQEIADELAIGLAEYRRMLAESNSSYLLSLEELQELIGEQEEPGEQQDEPLQQIIQQNLQQRVTQEIQQLPEREQIVLSLYYQHELTLLEIGKVLEVSESRVSQIHSQIMKRLRARLLRSVI